MSSHLITRRLVCLRHLPWYLSRPRPIPLCSDLDVFLPLPDLAGVTVTWPTRYSWPPAGRVLDQVKDALSAYVPIEQRPVANRDRVWHAQGGFPVPRAEYNLIGVPGHPKGPYDICGEVFEVYQGGRVVQCAYDCSDYPVISTDIAMQVDYYFKTTVPPTPLPPNVISAGYFMQNSRLLAKARALVLRGVVPKDIGVYGRFGTWTDSQAFRANLVERLCESSLPFVGGFGTRVYAAYMKELLRAKIAIDVPGQAPITCRLPEAMALGAVVVARALACVFPEPLLDGVHYVAMKEDASNVVEICQALLNDDERRQQIADNAMGYFDRNFSPQSRARRILQRTVAPTEERR